MASGVARLSKKEKSFYKYVNRHDIKIIIKICALSKDVRFSRSSYIQTRDMPTGGWHKAESAMDGASQPTRTVSMHKRNCIENLISVESSKFYNIFMSVLTFVERLFVHFESQGNLNKLAITTSFSFSVPSIQSDIIGRYQHRLSKIQKECSVTEPNSHLHSFHRIRK